MATQTVTLNVAVMTPELSSLIYGSSAIERFKFELLDNANYSKGFLNCVQIGGSVTNSYLADIKKTAQFTLSEIGNFDLINFQTDRVKIYYEIYNPTTDVWLSYPLGVFVLNPGSRVASKKIISRDIDAFDLTQVLKRRKHKDRYVVAVGADPIATVKILLTDAGLNYQIDDLIDPVGDAVVAERSYDAGSEYIATINDLLAMVNYRSLYFDRNGTATSGLYTVASDRLVDISYRTDSASIVADGASLAVDIFDVPNVVLVVVSQPDRPAMIGIARNDDPASLTSTVTTGDERTYVSSDNQDVTTQDQANIKARQVLSEQSQIYETIEFNSAIVPLHEENSILEIVHEDLGVSANYSETNWSIPLSPGSMMTHSARRVVQV